MKKRSLSPLPPPPLRSLLFTLLGGVPSAPGWVGFCWLESLRRDVTIAAVEAWRKEEGPSFSSVLFPPIRFLQPSFPLPLRLLLLLQKVMSTPSPPHMPGWRRQDKIGYPPSSPPPFLHPLAYKLMERGPLAFTGEGRGKKHLQTSPAPMHSEECGDEGGRGKKAFAETAGEM